MFHSIIIAHVSVEFLLLYNRTIATTHRGLQYLDSGPPSLKMSLRFLYTTHLLPLCGMAEHYQLTIPPPTLVNKYACGEIEIQIGDNFHI